MTKWQIIVLVGCCLLVGFVLAFELNTLGKETSGLTEQGEEELVLKDKPVQIYAHRGAKDRANEATLAAYDIAAKDGVDALEIDLRMTKDGVLVAMHDKMIDRTTDGIGNVETYTLEQLKRFNTVGVFNGSEMREPIPTLEEILQRYGKRETYYIETRLVGDQLKMEETLIQLLNDHDVLASQFVMLQSFSDASLARLTELAPEIPLTKLIRRGEFKLDEALQSPYQTIGAEAGDLHEADVQALRTAGKAVHVYFTDSDTEREEQQRVNEYGIDGLFTDQIEFTKKLLETE
ncbi:glycerophosphoryl diester phosphodiesterase [Alkalihalobacillus xiaoxiensis]|uniref:Glycerophosphoryl diester phosphodiesterase n=1 Tax=Shouchella xiaoxiensis TaxID=766895 RepID=A0ABS2STP4_9BACI|nr:glycerophosphodiester phosphodiesterase family protein [Shouchella xiaoxiensis]MBM7838867.1 glycerophosphoryl diester phosphodiesterase [Shouchella xiaoxiensis]